MRSTSGITAPRARSLDSRHATPPNRPQPAPHPGERNYATLAANCLRLAVFAGTGQLAGVRDTLPDVAPAPGGRIAAVTALIFSCLMPHSIWLLAVIGTVLAPTALSSTASFTPPGG